MNEIDLDKWWSGLKIAEKERIAGKILMKNPDIKGQVEYPHCTVLWESLDDKKKAWIHDHCVFRHGQLDKVDFDGNPLT